MPEIKRANPSRDLSILYTCQKLWEESWRAIQDHNYIVMPFDPTAEYFPFEGAPAEFLARVRNIKAETPKYDDDDDWWKEYTPKLVEIVVPPSTCPLQRNIL